MESFDDLSINDCKVVEKASANNSARDQKQIKRDDEADDSNWETDEENGHKIMPEGDQNDEIWDKRAKVWKDEELFGADLSLKVYNEESWKIVEQPHWPSGEIFLRTKDEWHKNKLIMAKTVDPYEDDWSLENIIGELRSGHMPMYDEAVSAKYIKWPKDTATFEPFPRLPMELRIKIWKYALPEPRVVFFLMDRYYGKHQTRGKEDNRCARLIPEKYWNGTNRIKSPDKRLLLTCKEAASVFKDNYGKIQIHKRRKDTHISTATVGQYFGWKRDTLVFEISYIRNAKEDLPYKRVRNWGEFCFSVDLSKVEKPAPCVLFHHNRATIVSTLNFLRRECPKAKEITFVLNHFDHGYYRSYPEGDFSSGLGEAYLLNIDETLLSAKWSKAQSGGHENCDFTSWGQRSALKYFIDEARYTHAKLRDLGSTQEPKIKAFLEKAKVALFTKKSYKFEDSVKLLWLIPTAKQSLAVIYYTKRAADSPPGGWISSQELPFALKCEADGTLIQMNDGGEGDEESGDSESEGAEFSENEDSENGEHGQDSSLDNDDGREMVYFRREFYEQEDSESADSDLTDSDDMSD